MSRVASGLKVDGDLKVWTSAQITSAGVVSASSFRNYNYSGSKALVSDSSKNIVESSVTSAEIGYLGGTTSNIQTQINSINLFAVSGQNFTIASNENTGNYWVKLGTGTIPDTYTYHQGSFKIVGGYQGRFAAECSFNIHSVLGAAISATSPSPRIRVNNSDGMDPTKFYLILTSDYPSTKTYEIWFNIPSAYSSIAFSFSALYIKNGTFVINNTATPVSAASVGTSYQSSQYVLANNINLQSLNTSAVVVTDGSKNLVSSPVTTTELGYLTGTTSNIQNQINYIYSDASNVVIKNPTAQSDQVISGAIKIQKNGVGDYSFGTLVTGDTYSRSAILNTGFIEWGPGNAARDTNLYRQTTSALKTDSTFETAKSFRTVGQYTSNFSGNGVEVDFNTSTLIGRVLTYDRTNTVRRQFQVDALDISFLTNNGTQTAKFTSAGLFEIGPNANTNIIQRIYRPTNTASNTAGIVFNLRDSASSQVDYAGIFGGIETNTSAAYNGIVKFQAAKTGTLSDIAYLSPNGFRIGDSLAYPRTNEWIYIPYTSDKMGIDVEYQATSATTNNALIQANATAISATLLSTQKMVNIRSNGVERMSVFSDGSISANVFNASTVLVADANKRIASSTVTSGDLSYISGLNQNLTKTSNVQFANISGTTYYSTSFVGPSAYVLVSNTSKQIVESSITTQKLGYLGNVSADIQTQLNQLQQLSISGGGSGTVNRIAKFITTSSVGNSNMRDDGSTIFFDSQISGTTATFSNLTVGNVSNTELQYVDGVSANIQTQLSNLSATAHSHTNKTFLDTINQNLNSSASPTFAGLAASDIYGTNSIYANKFLTFTNSATPATPAMQVYSNSSSNIKFYSNIGSDTIFDINLAAGAAITFNRDILVNANDLSAAALYNTAYTGGYALYSNAAKQIVESTTPYAKLAFLNNTSADIQSQLSSIVNTKADKTITITAGTGLTGGGDLSTNRTISLPSVGTAGTYTKVSTDAQGRVSAATNITSADVPNLDISKITTGQLSWARISAIPTSLVGYGITTADTLFDSKYAPYNVFATVQSTSANWIKKYTYSHGSNSQYYTKVASLTATAAYATYSQIFNIANRRGSYSLHVRFETGASSSAVGAEYASSFATEDYDAWRITRSISTNAVWEIWFKTREYASLSEMSLGVGYNSSFTASYTNTYTSADPGSQVSVRYVGPTSIDTWNSAWNTTNLPNPIDGSGSVSYIPRFSDSNTLTTSNITDSGTLITLGSDVLCSSTVRLTPDNSGVIYNTTLPVYSFGQGVATDDYWLIYGEGLPNIGQLVLEVGDNKNEKIIFGYRSSIDLARDDKYSFSNTTLNATSITANFSNVTVGGTNVSIVGHTHTNNDITGVVDGSGTAERIPRWIAASTLGDSSLNETATELQFLNAKPINLRTGRTGNTQKTVFSLPVGSLRYSINGNGQIVSTLWAGADSGSAPTILQQSTVGQIGYGDSGGGINGDLINPYVTWNSTRLTLDNSVAINSTEWITYKQTSLITTATTLSADITYYVISASANRRITLPASPRLGAIYYLNVVEPTFKYPLKPNTSQTLFWTDEYFVTHADSPDSIQPPVLIAGLHLVTTYDGYRWTLEGIHTTE